ncbi:P-loop containing nucleoside triphosphate hydrolase protein [Stipitochalara longipes BDJ]|nr:P-loop containing nucleoside triphosphate hydrolase protein [Stipitochalara longipes BDJ]
MEVITTISVTRKSQHTENTFNPELARGTDQGTEVKINSPLLVNALRAVVSYYPGSSLLEEPLTIEEPYQLLVHHRKDLEAYKDNHPPNHTPEYREECNQHIDIILEFLRQNFEGGLELEEERHKQDPPTCTFEYLWMIFKPGVDVYTRSSAAPLASPYSVFVVSSIDGGHFEHEIGQYKINIWELQSNGEFLIRNKSYIDIIPFDGEKEIRSLAAYPLSFIPEGERNSLKQRLITRGKRYYDYTAIAHKHFHGYTFSTPRRLYDTRVVLDTATALESSELDVRDYYPINEDDKSIGVSGCSCTACSKTKNIEGKARFAGYDQIPLKTSESSKTLSDHQYLICSQNIFGFALKQRSWQRLDMDAIRDITFDKNSINDLVLDPEENKSLLKALAKRYAQKPADIDVRPPVIKDGVTVVGNSLDGPYTADFVEGKGEGQIILLHGPPGVGKTCTAESVAEFTERPLLSLSCSDIGTDPMSVEFNLNKWMKLARRWGAILLIDEADVYLEERTAQDFQRNSLVSSKFSHSTLRYLEYYQGILFLTTNRVGVFDEAFASRIHISMWYPGFDDIKRVKVWKSMIAKLQRERKDIKVPYDLNKYIEKDDDLRRVEWNGREIRNAFQTVVALAEYQATEEKSTEIELKIDYLDQVVKMSRRFKDYLSTLPDGNVSKKALRYGKRNDDFNK